MYPETQKEVTNVVTEKCLNAFLEKYKLLKPSDRNYVLGAVYGFLIAKGVPIAEPPPTRNQAS